MVRHGDADTAGVVKRLGFGEDVGTTISEAARQADRSRFVILGIGIFALFSASAAGAKTFVAVDAIVWGLPVRRPRQTLRAAGAFTGTALLALSLPLAANWARSQSPGIGIGATVSSLVAFAALWFLVSWMLPHSDARGRDLIPGALIAAVATQLFHLVTVYYLVHKVESASHLYGSFGAAAALLLWLYLLGRLVVANANINATLWERRQARLGAPTG